VWWINETIFGLLSSFILTLVVSVSPELLCIVFPTFLFYVTSVTSFHLHLGLPLPCFLCGLLKICDVSQRARMPPHAHIT
jgi:hypothetical protein